MQSQAELSAVVLAGEVVQPCSAAVAKLRGQLGAEGAE